MKIARVKDAETWHFLGKKNLLRISGLILDFNKETPITDLFEMQGFGEAHVEEMTRPLLDDAFKHVEAEAVAVKKVHALTKSLKDLTNALQDVKEEPKVVRHLNEADSIAMVDALQEIFAP